MKIKLEYGEPFIVINDKGVEEEVFCCEEEGENGIFEMDGEYFTMFHRVKNDEIDHFTQYHAKVTNEKIYEIPESYFDKFE